METKKKVNTKKLTAKQKEQLNKTTPQVSTDSNPAPAESMVVTPVVGSRTATANLIQMGTKLVEAARFREIRLETDGKWPKESTDGLAEEVTQFAIASTVAKAESKRSTAAYQAQVRKSRGFRNRLAAKIRVAALAKPEVLEETPLYLGEMTNAVKLMVWFNDVQAPMQALRTQLENESPDTDWFALLQTETQALAQAMGAQELRKSQQSSRVSDRIAARNKLVGSIQTLYTRAHDVFVDSPNVLKEFSKWSFRKHKSAKAAPVSGTSSGSGTSSAPAGMPPGPQSTTSTGSQAATSTGTQAGATSAAAAAPTTGAGAPAAEPTASPNAEPHR